ncbi:MAG: hypothetical protein KC897_04325 [Candidatus Omnitrophica bacterium]|nr:hypothetical protein [Candidatus Omnitrophota bacterium]MCB9720745.1 hypothetical protein [Candidatus Omnitrophota bacterium]
MSIINDALKRAQQRMKKGGQDAPPENSSVQDLTREQKPPSVQHPHPHPHLHPRPKPEGDKPSLKKKKVWYRTVSALVVIFFFITGILLATLFFLMKRSATETDPTAVLRREYMPKPLKRNFKPGELILSGTSFVEDKRVALINDGIYEVGDIVEGYRVTSIELREVQLENLRGDNAIVLRTRSNN